MDRELGKEIPAGEKADVELEIDHITPISKGGRTIECNLQTM